MTIIKFHFILLVSLYMLSACTLPKPDTGSQTPLQRMSVKEISLRISQFKHAQTHAVLQFENNLTLKQRSDLNAMGIQLITASGNNQWIASVPKTLTAKQLTQASLRRLDLITANSKLDPALRAGKPGTQAERIPGEWEVLVKLFAGSDVEQTKKEMQSMGIEIRQDASANFNILLVSGKPETINALTKLNSIRYIEPSMAAGGAESGRARAFIGADVAQATGLDGSGVNVGIFEYGHALLSHPDFGSRVTKGDADTLEVAQHTTMTAGIIAGDGSQSTSSQWRGVAPDVNLKTYAFKDSVSSVTNYLGDVQDAIQNDDVNIGNNSWGDFGCNTIAYGAYAGRAPFLDEAIRGAHGRKIPIIFSAGNERSGYPVYNSVTDSWSTATDCITDTSAPFANYSTINHPKSSKNILAVGAVDSANDRMSNYSSWGPTLDGRLKPEVVAAGHHNGTLSSNITRITNAFGTPTGATNQQAYRVPNDDTASFMYAWYSQTSSAAAMTAGTYALMLDKWRQTFPDSPDPLPSTYKALITHTARDLNDTTVSWYNPGPDYASGYGVIQTDNAVDAIGKRMVREAEVINGSSAAYMLNLQAGTPQLKVTLAWDDPAALENANATLINDLDLIVIEPDGTTRHYPWTLNPNTPAAAAVKTGEDHINNLEQVLVNNPTPGIWQISVAGTNVAIGPQQFSIVADQGPVRRPLDMVLALDISSSMSSIAAGGGGLTKIELLKQSVVLFLQTWSLHAVIGDRVGIVYFGDDLSSLSGVPPVLQDFPANLNNLISSINTVNASGCTAMGAAIQEAFNSFPTVGNNKRGIVLFSDGMQSTNPFIGEEGSPAKLKIRSFANNESLPFGAFRCNSNTANGLDGNASTVDGLFIDAHDTEIYTIGTGVNGAGFETLIRRIASETNGLHHFTSAPDTNLDLFFTNDLVQSLKSNTLEIVSTEQGTLTANSFKTISFPVNTSVRNVSLVLSWKGQLGHNVLQQLASLPDGSIIQPDEVRQGLHYIVARYDRPSAGNSFNGMWHVRLTSKADNHIKFQQSVIVDEGCLGYQVAQSHDILTAGDKSHLTLKLTEKGRPLKNLESINVRVSSPVFSHANVISKWTALSREKPSLLPKQLNRETFKPESLNYEKSLEILSQIPDFYAELSRVTNSTIKLLDNGNRKMGDWKAGDGIYSGYLKDTRVVGNYELEYNISAKSSCGGQLIRKHRDGIVIRAAKIELERSILDLQRDKKGIIVTLKPVDRFGNLIGAGKAHLINIRVKSSKSPAKVIDMLDGQYRVQLEVNPDSDPEIIMDSNLGIGEPIYKGKLSMLKVVTGN